MNFYSHHINDYAEATAHLTFVEDAAYSRLIRKYYSNEKPLPADIKAVQRLICARTDEEKEAVETILNEFFTLEEDGWHNARCDEEIAAYRDKQEKASRSAKSRWQKQQEQPEESERNANAMRTHSERNANAMRTNNHKPITNNQEPITKGINKNNIAREKIRDSDFDLPDWIPEDSWSGFVEMRKARKRPLTERARDLIIRKLDDFRQRGFDIEAILDTSTTNGWIDVYEPKLNRPPSEKLSLFEQNMQAAERAKKLIFGEEAA